MDPPAASVVPTHSVARAYEVVARHPYRRSRELKPKVYWALQEADIGCAHTSGIEIERVFGAIFATYE